MSMRDLDKEQQRVDEVIAKMKLKSAALEQQAGAVKSEVVGIRQNFWEDVTVNFDDAVEAAETFTSLKQQVELLAERERSHRHGNEQLKTLKRLQSSPYFGRIDFIEDGEEEERIYLGVGSFYDEETEQFLVYDWRAPISSLYYDYGIGPAQYEAPGGMITGEMKRKRQFVIRNSHIESMFDTGITIGDEMLREVLGKQANTQMKSIVATIQKEQNRIIRNDTSRLLVVQGAAGSGKTSAALQRVAYLLYRYRGGLNADQIVLFSPNSMFNSYVATVLPELGEENMQQATFQEYLERQLGKHFDLEDPFTQMEYALSSKADPSYPVRMASIRYKATMHFMQLIERYIDTLGEEGLIFKDIMFREEVLISAAQIHERFYNLDASLSIPNRMQLVAEWLRTELKRLERSERKKPWVEEEMQFLDNDIYARAYRRLQKKKEYSEQTFDDFKREEQLLATVVVQEKFKPLCRLVKRLQFLDAVAVYKQLFTLGFAEQFQMDLPEQWEYMCKQTVEKVNRAELFYEDATPYLYLKEQLEGFQRNTSVRHVFVDEAQDYSPFQFAFLKKLFPLARMTVLGDLNQAIHAHAADNGFMAAEELYGPKQTETIILTRSYRSTRPIIEFTSQLISGGENIEPFNREGEKPSITNVLKEQLAQCIIERVRSLQSAGHETIAVICKTASESKEAYDAMRDALQLRLIRKESASFEPGVLVIPSYLAKGVEFDAVIVYDASQYWTEDRKLFYTVCTRAMHELYLYASEEENPLLAGVSEELYVQG